MLSVTYKKAMGEVLQYLKGIEESDIKKIPNKMILYFKKNAIQVPEFDYNVELKEMEISQEAKSIIALICYKYWCDDDTKKMYSEMLKENNEDYEEQKRKQYDIENIFSQRAKTENTNTAMIETPKKRKTIFTKIFEKIKIVLGGRKKK